MGVYGSCCFFSKIKMMVIFGVANLAILLIVMEVWFAKTLRLRRINDF